MPVVTRFEDLKVWQKARQMNKAVYELFIREDIVPLNRAGIAAIENVVRGVLDLGIRQGIADGEREVPYQISVPKPTDINAGNVGISRFDPCIKFSDYKLRQSVHNAKFSGSVSKL